MASSRGVPTVCASTAGFAPGYTARTVMVGGVTSGYSLTGSAKTAIKPAARTTSDSTTAKTGRSMKKREKRTGSAPERTALLDRPRGRGGIGQHGGRLGGDLHPRPHAQQAVDDDLLAGLEPRLHDAEAVGHPTDRDRPVLHRAVGLE